MNISNSKKAYDEDGPDEQNATMSKKSPVLLDLFEEVKNAPPPKNPNNHEEVSSDDHDEGEDLESSKLAEFNTLVIQTKQKVKQSQGSSMSRINENEEYLDDPIIMNKPKRSET